AGRVTNARAIATRCCSPPESCRGECPGRPCNRTPASVCMAVSRASARPASSSGSMTFSSAVSAGSRWKDWNTNPPRCARRRARPSSSSFVRSSPARSTRPRVGRSSPASRASSVDLPAPDGPVTATDSPAAMSSETSSTMVSEPSGLLTCLLRFSALRTLLRITGAWALGMGLLFIALQNAVASDRTILVFGDSLSAAYGIRPEQGWVALLTQRLQAQEYGYEIINASVSGETTSGGLQRLPRALQLHRPGIVVL